MAARGAKVLEPIWVREAGRKGRLSIQTNPTFFRDPQRMLEQGRYFHTLAPNMQVKFPATNAGLRALEDATYHGVSINATVNFTLPQALAVGEAVERALRRRTGRASRSSRRLIASSTSAAIAPACSQPPTATTCTGPS